MSQQVNAKDNAGIGVGVVQPQSGLDYPFVSPGLKADPTYLLDVRELFADFYLSYDDPGYYPQYNAAAITHPLRIYWLYGFGGGPAWSTGAQPLAGLQPPENTHAKDLIVVDHQNIVVFDSTKADYYEEFVWGQNYKIIEWRRTFQPEDDSRGLVYLNAQKTPKVAICRAVQFLNLHTNTTIPERPIEFCPRNATLDERTIEKIPKRVLAMRVQNGNCVTPWFNDKVTFVNGHNTEIDIGEDAAALPGAPIFTTSLRRKTNIMFNAVPGTGAGQFGLCATGNCDDDSPPNACEDGTDVEDIICKEEEIKILNGVVPDPYGNINISAKDCLFSRAPTTYTNDTPSKIPSALHIGSDCPPCCSCDDYLNTADYIRSVGEQYQIIGEKTEAAQQLHKSNIDRWNEQRLCRTRRPLRLLLVAQPCPCMDVVAMYCNQCSSCAENVNLVISFSTDPDGAKAYIDHKYTQIVGADYAVPAVLGGGWPIFSVNFSRVSAGDSVYAKFRLCFCPAHPYDITGVLSGTKSNQPILAGCEPTASAAVVTTRQILDCVI